MTITYTRPKLADYQEESLFNDYRYCWIIGSTKSGKSHAAGTWLVEQALLLENPKGKHCWWVAPSHLQAKIMFDRLKQALDPRTFTANETNKTITLLNGAIIDFKSADNPDLLFGEDVYAVVVDEASRCREKAYYAIRSTVTSTQGKIRLIGNVRGRNNFFWKNAQEAKLGKANHGYFEMNSADAVNAGILPWEEVEDAKESLPIDVFNELYLNIPNEDGSNPFNLKCIEECCTENLVDLGNGETQRVPRGLSTLKPVCYGIDLGKSIDFTVIIGLDQSGAVCFFERFKENWDFTLEKIIDIVKDKPALVDSSSMGGNMIMDFLKTKNFVGFPFTPKSKQELMEGLAVGIQSNQVRFPDNEIRTELDAYEYEYTRTGIRYKSSIHDDTVCALALAFKQYLNKPKEYLTFLFDQ